MNTTDTHPAIQKIQNIITNRPKPSPAPSLPKDDDTPLKLLDPPLFKKAVKLLNPPLMNKLTSISKKFTAKAIKPIKSIPEPRSPTKPTRIPNKFDYNHTSKSWKP